MKNLVLCVALLFAFATVAVSQATPTSSQSNNEGVVAYSFLREDVKIQRPVFVFESDTDSHGFNAAYTRYMFGGSSSTANTVGFTADLGANIDNNNASLITFAGGVTVKGRNYKYVQPFARALGGVALRNVDRLNITNTQDVSGAAILGGGVDFNTSAYSRYKVGVGADYVGTGFNGLTQHGARLTARFVF